MVHVGSFNVCLYRKNPKGSKGHMDGFATKRQDVHRSMDSIKTPYNGYTIVNIFCTFFCFVKAQLRCVQVLFNTER